MNNAKWHRASFINNVLANLFLLRDSCILLLTQWKYHRLWVTNKRPLRPRQRPRSKGEPSAKAEIVVSKLPRFETLPEIAPLRDRKRDRTGRQLRRRLCHTFATMGPKKPPEKLTPFFKHAKSMTYSTLMSECVRQHSTRSKIAREWSPPSIVDRVYFRSRCWPHIDPPIEGIAHEN